MTNSKNTKRALLTSAFAILLCFVMLIGTTFAWFTDSASTGVNKIQAGTLDIQLVDKDGNDLEGKTLDFAKAAGHESEAILWEPGCTYELPAVYVKNNGNLALKYKIQITGIKGDAKLNEAIEWTIGGLDLDTEGTLLAGKTSDALTIKGHMKEDAGNEYQGLSIEGIAITVVATQDTVEYDSYNNTYDANATYPDVWDGTAASAEALAAATDTTAKTVSIGSASMLAAFANAVNTDNATYAGYTVTLTNNIDLGNQAWTPINWDNRTGFTFDGNGKTISNFTVTTKLGERNTGFFSFADFTTIKDLTISGATVTGTNHVGALVGGAYCNTIENCTVKDSTITALTWYSTGNEEWDDGDKAGALAGYLDETSVTVKGCTVTGCTVKGYRDVGGLIGYLGMNNNTITGNTVSSTTITLDNTHNYKNYTETAQNDVNELIGEIQGSSNTISDNNTTIAVTVTR